MNGCVWVLATFITCCDGEEIGRPVGLGGVHNLCCGPCVLVS